MWKIIEQEGKYCHTEFVVYTISGYKCGTFDSRKKAENFIKKLKKMRDKREQSIMNNEKESEQ